MIIVFSTVDTAEQGVGRAECTEAIGDDYVNGAVVREVQIPLPQPSEHTIEIRTPKVRMTMVFSL